MTSIAELGLISVDDYLASELVSDVKQEYVGGLVYRMATARIVHSIMAGNIFAGLHSRLRGSRCRPYNSDTKIRVRLPTQVRFYYPDASVVCHSNSQADSFQDKPVLIVEVLSRKTRRIDEWEKKEAYLAIPSLGTYILVEEKTPAIAVHRRTEQGFVREVYSGLDAVVPLPDFDTQLPLSEIYDGVEFTPEQEEELA